MRPTESQLQEAAVLPSFDTMKFIFNGVQVKGGKGQERFLCADDISEWFDRHWDTILYCLTAMSDKEKPIWKLHARGRYISARGFSGISHVEVPLHIWESFSDFINRIEPRSDWGDL